MEKIYIDPEIYYVENFIDKEDINVILKDFMDDSDWQLNGVFYLKEAKGERARLLLQEKYRKKVSELIDDDYNIVKYQTTLQKYCKTENEYSINPHSDRFDAEYLKTGELTSRYVTKGYIMYFNDEYEGGEVFYVNKNIQIRPRSGMILVHSGFEEYTHGVKKVTSGERYFCSGFVYEKDFFEKNMI